MKNYTSLDTYNLEGYGLVYVVENDCERERSELSFLIGTVVLIDGKRHMIKGVESRTIQVISKGSQIGLLV